MNIIKSYIDSMSQQILVFILVAIILGIVFILVGRMFEKADPLAKPSPKMNLVLVYFNFIESLCDSVFKSHVKGIRAYVGMLFLLILTSNYIPLLLPVDAPTTDYNVPLGLVIVSMGIMYGTDFKYNGIKSHVTSYFKPFAFLFPLNLMDIISKPLSMSMRLFVNMLSGSVILGLFYSVMASLQGAFLELLPISNGIVDTINLSNIFGAITAVGLHLYFDLFSGFLQAFVFTLLTLVFTSLSLDFDSLDEQEANKKVNVKVIA